ncbi:alpha/beta fold hydrolase [Weissella cibaria]|uniref:alpha/beta fold hydrolase n=1 Tax=Weissella cibaria TaxID=137591 RepID=UPI00223B53F8|nr:alpha/beta hydrolase [Weissella cibaria]
MMNGISLYKTVNIDGINIFYREMGSTNKPVLLLLHGFPSASHMFRDLMPLLSERFRLIAPDYPGFGQSDAPLRAEFDYTFDNLADVMNKFIRQLDIPQFYLYVFDYGAPIGFRIAKNSPDKILGIVSQNGNIYEEGLGEKWQDRKAYWANPTIAKRETYKQAFAPKTIINQYLDGTMRERVSPDGYTLDIAYTQSEEYAERQSDLIFDYRNNVAKYEEFQQYICEYQPKILAVWGKNDVSFIPQGAKAFRKDSENVQIYLLDTGHFALETHAAEIAQMISSYF